MGEVVRIVDLAERMIRLRGLRPYKDIDIDFTGCVRAKKCTKICFTNQKIPKALRIPILSN